MSHYQPLSRPAVSSTGTTPHPVAINSSLTPTSCGQPNEVSCVGGGGSCDGVREVHGGPTCVGGGGSCDSVREVHGGPTCVGGGGSCDGVREVHGGATCAGGVGSCDGVREVHGGATLCAGGGGSCDGVREVHRGATAPDTPQRASQTNPVTPLTPLANLKVLMAAAAASSAMEGREGGGEGVVARGGEGEVPVKREEEEVGGAKEQGSTAGRKMKSLALLSKRFLTIVETSVGTGNEFSLDMMAQNLGTNRRRIYDIINVMEALEMIVKQSKNWYTWNGRSGLLNTLAKLKAMAGDDPDLLQWFKNDCKENVTPPTVVAKQQGQSLNVHDESSQDSTAEEVPCDDGQTKGGRWDKSLGILCQKFIMLFLIAPGHELTLDLAGGILMPDDDSSIPTTCTAGQTSTNPKTKVRRLYDIANVLTTLDLIRKKTFMAPNHRKMPGYVWCGPSMEEIDTVSVYRKSEFPVVYSRKMKGTALVRKPSFGSRPFIHQYEVKDSNSAPNTPCKSVPTTKPLGGIPVGNFTGGRGGGSIRRSLSFGGQSSRSIGTPSSGRKVGGARSEERQPSTSSVLVRPLCSKQVDYINEVKEFELEMRKHSHRYPHVVSVFQDFIRRYQLSLEQAAVVGGRTILPKPPSPPPIPTQHFQLNPRGFSTPNPSMTPTINSNESDFSLNFSNLSSSVTSDQSSSISPFSPSLQSLLAVPQDVTSQPVAPRQTTPLTPEEVRGVSSEGAKPSLVLPAAIPDAASSTATLHLVLPGSSLTDHQQHMQRSATSSSVVPLHPPPTSARDGYSISSTTTPPSTTSAIPILSLSDVVVHHLGNTAVQSNNVPPAPAPQGFTKGTIQSPEKPAHFNVNNSFVRVEDFLTALTGGARSGVRLQDPRLGNRRSNGAESPSLLAPPTGVQPMVTSLLSQLLTTQQQPITRSLKVAAVAPNTQHVPLNPSSLVNQRPISAITEVKSKTHLGRSSGVGSYTQPQPQPPADLNQSSIAGVPFIGPNALISTPPQFFPPQAVLPNTSMGFIPLTPNVLPSFTSLCPPLTSPVAKGSAASEESPPKRAKLNN